MLIPLRDVNPRTRKPIVTSLLIALNALVFFFELSLDPRAEALLFQVAGAIPFEIVHGIDRGPRNLLPLPWTILSSMFLHGGFMHVLGNMWFLWLFGDNVEDVLGHVRYFVFYFVCGVVAALSQCFAMPDSLTPMIGASGAVAGILGGYFLLHPRAQVLSLVPIPFFFNIIPVRAWLFLGLWFVGQFLLGQGSGVAWMAHVGGFLAGMGLVKLFAPRRPPPKPIAVEAEYIPPRERRW